MAAKTQSTQWSVNVRKAVRGLAKAGVREAPSALFASCEHVTIRVDGLDGIAVIHQQDLTKPYRICVFEPSDRDEDGYAEIFERNMNSLDELPQRVEEWRTFRAKTDCPGAEGWVDHLAWLRAVAKEKKAALADIRESGRLAAAGDRKGAWKAAGFDVKVPQKLPADTPPIAKERLLEDFSAVAPDLLAWHLPRDERGKWLLKRRVPLFRYDGDKRRMSVFCLLVAMPDKRSGRPEIRAEWLQADLQTARLDAVPELFDTRKSTSFASELLGVKSTRGWWSSRKSSSPALQSLQLQAKGLFEKAGELSGVELDDTILECMRARRVAHMCTCCAPLDRQLIEWSAVLKQTLTALNFPRVTALALRDQEQFARKPRKEPIPIVPFPLQRHIRKAHIALDIRDPRRPRLTVDVTGSGNRLPLALWTRPADVDLLREGLLAPSDLPEAVAAQLGIGE